MDILADKLQAARLRDLEHEVGTLKSQVNLYRHLLEKAEHEIKQLKTDLAAIYSAEQGGG